MAVCSTARLGNSGGNQRLYHQRYFLTDTIITRVQCLPCDIMFILFDTAQWNTLMILSKRNNIVRFSSSQSCTVTSLINPI